MIPAVDRQNKEKRGKIWEKRGSLTRARQAQHELANLVSATRGRSSNSAIERKGPARHMETGMKYVTHMVTRCCNNGKASLSAPC